MNGAPYVQTYTNLWLACLTPEMHARTCDYWYTVSQGGGTAHTAFHDAAGLLAWLDERGLQLTEALPIERGTHKWMDIVGAYRMASYMNVLAFKQIVPLRCISLMENAEDTLGKVTLDADGIHTLHYLNVNVRTPERRKNYQQLVEGGSV